MCIRDSSWDNAAEPVKALIPLEGRTPLLSAMDSSTANVLSMVFGFLGAKWEKDPDNSNVLVMPEGSNPEIGYSLGDFLNALKGTTVGTVSYTHLFPPYPERILKNLPRK